MERYKINIQKINSVFVQEGLLSPHFHCHLQNQNLCVKC